MVLYDLMVDGKPAALRTELGEDLSMICNLDIKDEVEKVYHSNSIFSLFTVLDKIKNDGYKVEFPRRDLTS